MLEPTPSAAADRRRRRAQADLFIAAPAFGRGRYTAIATVASWMVAGCTAVALAGLVSRVCIMRRKFSKHITSIAMHATHLAYFFLTRIHAHLDQHVEFLFENFFPEKLRPRMCLRFRFFKKDTPAKFTFPKKSSVTGYTAAVC